MTPLPNLGSVIAHALDLEVSLQEAAAAQGDDDRVQASRQRAAELSRIRREVISEMILEPLSGIEAIDLAGLSLAEAQARLAAFYENAAERVTIPAAGRALRRLARRCA
jgi:hypothetical protein